MSREDRNMIERKEGISSISGNLVVYTMQQARAIHHS